MKIQEVKNLIREETKKLLSESIQKIKFKSPEELSKMTEFDITRYSNDLRIKRNQLHLNGKENQQLQKEIELADSFRKNLNESSIRSLIKEIINQQKSFSPFSGAIVNNICDECGLPENACPHGENSFVGKKNDDKMAKISNMTQLKEMIRKEVKSLLEEKKKTVYYSKHAKRNYKYDDEGSSIKKGEAYYWWIENGKIYRSPEDEENHSYVNVIDREETQNTINRVDEYRKSVRARKFEEDYGKSMNKITEVAPPGMEDVVLKLKKKYPKGSASPFKIAWAQYNKKNGKK